MSAENLNERPENHVRVGFHGSKFLYVDITKHLLDDGHQQVVVSALGMAINEAVSVVEMLKDQSMVTVVRIETSRGEIEGVHRRPPTDKIEITVVKAPGFDQKYGEQQQMLDAKKKAKESASAENE